MKRLVVLLIVLAGGLAAAAFAVPSNAATVNGASISQQPLNSDLTAIADSPEYQCYLKAEQAVESNGEVKLPPVDGAGHTDTGGSHPTVTTAFAANYLDTEILHQLILELAAKDHVDPTAQDLSAARASLVAQITEVLQEVEGSAYACGATPVTGKVVLATLPGSFVDENVRFDAGGEPVRGRRRGCRCLDGRPGAVLRGSPGRVRHGVLHRGGVLEPERRPSGAGRRWRREPRSPQAASAAGGGPRGCGILYGVADQLPAGADLTTPPQHGLPAPRRQWELLLDRDHQATPVLIRQGPVRRRGCGAERSAPARPVWRSARRSGRP